MLRKMLRRWRLWCLKAIDGWVFLLPCGRCCGPAYRRAGPGAAAERGEAVVALVRSWLDSNSVRSQL